MAVSLVNQCTLPYSSAISLAVCYSLVYLLYGALAMPWSNTLDMPLALICYLACYFILTFFLHFSSTFHRIVKIKMAQTDDIFSSVQLSLLLLDPAPTPLHPVKSRDHPISAQS